MELRTADAVDIRRERACLHLGRFYGYDGVTQTGYYGRNKTHYEELVEVTAFHGSQITRKGLNFRRRQPTKAINYGTKDRKSY